MEYLYSLCKSTMENYVIQAWGAWVEDLARRGLEQALNSEEFSAIIYEGERIGAVSILRHDTHYQLEELYISGQYQNRGIGAKIVRDLIAIAKQEGKPIRLRVLTSNPAKSLYDRLGFVVTKTEPERYFMEYHV